jgi:hypothetical protein
MKDRGGRREMMIEATRWEMENVELVLKTPNELNNHGGSVI